MPQRYFRKTKIHDNGNLVCAIDIETTGLDPYENSILELAVVPLTPDYELYKEINPFNMLMKPIDGKKIEQEALTINKIDLPWVMLNCLTADRVLDLFLDWVQRLQLGEKKIIPLAHNWPFDSAFLKTWMGPLTYSQVFAHNYCDTMVVAQYINDLYDTCCERIPYPKINLRYLASTLKIENPDVHRALGDAVTTAKVYKHFVESIRV